MPQTPIIGSCKALATPQAEFPDPPLPVHSNAYLGLKSLVRNSMNESKSIVSIGLGYIPLLN